MIRLVNAGRKEGEAEVVHDTLWTWANLITLLRFMGLPVVVWLIFGPREYLLAVLVLALVGATDWVDGYVARRFNQVSRFGTLVDPVADRLMLIVIATALMIAGIAPWWLLAAIVVPDAILAVFSAVLFHGAPDLTVSIVGKVRTAFLLVGTPMMLAGKSTTFADGPLWAAGLVVTTLGCVGHWLAGIQYVVGMFRAKQRVRVADHG